MDDYISLTFPDLARVRRSSIAESNLQEHTFLEQLLQVDPCLFHPVHCSFQLLAPSLQIQPCSQLVPVRLCFWCLTRFSCFAFFMDTKQVNTLILTALTGRKIKVDLHVPEKNVASTLMHPPMVQRIHVVLSRLDQTCSNAGQKSLQLRWLRFRSRRIRQCQRYQHCAVMQIASFLQGRNGFWMPPCKLRPLQSMVLWSGIGAKTTWSYVQITFWWRMVATSFSAQWILLWIWLPPSTLPMGLTVTQNWGGDFSEVVALDRSLANG